MTDNENKIKALECYISELTEQKENAHRDIADYRICGPSDYYWRVLLRRYNNVVLLLDREMSELEYFKNRQ